MAADPVTIEEYQTKLTELQTQLYEAQRQIEYLSAENQALGESVHEYLVASIKMRTDAKVAQRQVTQAIESRDAQIKALQVELQNPRHETDVGPASPAPLENPDDVTVPDEVTAPAALNGQKKRKGRYAE